MMGEGLSADRGHRIVPEDFQALGTLRAETLRRQKAWSEITKLKHTCWKPLKGTQKDP